MKKLFLIALTFIAFNMVSFQSAQAAVNYSCPLPSQVNCVPALNTIGPWRANGGQMTGNSFMPNNQCANVITLPNNDTRLLCCYTKCGVFILDVPSTRCKKISEARFTCAN